MIGKVTLAAALAGAVVLGSLPAAYTAAGGMSPIDVQQIGGVTKSKYGVYVVIMELDPTVAYEGGIKGYAPTKPGKGRKINPNSAHVKKYSGLLKQEQSKALRKVALDASRMLHSYTIALNGFAAKMTLDQANALARTQGVRMVLPDEWRYRTTDSSPDFLGLTEPGGAYSKQFTGEGVVVGVIDDGIWPEHSSFADDGSYAPLPTYAGLPCEFGNTAHNPNDAPFTCNNKLLGARQMLATYRALIGAEPDEFDSARDDNGHGTHTASTAAGNAGVAASLYGMALGTISGIAPRARVIAYKGLGQLGGFTSDLAAAIDQAVADGVDVINYSIGGGAGGPGADVLAFLFAADAGVHVATSAGNSGPNPATLGNPGTMPWLTTVGASTQSRFFEGTITLGNGSVYTGASITRGLDTNLPLVDAASAGGELCIPGTLNPDIVKDMIVLCRRGEVGRAEKGLAVDQAGGLGMILYNTVDTDNLFTDTHWTPTVHIDYTPGLAIKGYIASDPNPTARITTGEVGIWPYAPSMTIFSSRGPNPVAPDIIKPDITAPGLQILAGYSPTPDPGSTTPGELFAAIAGTSMSSPHVAGIFALMDQAHPDWSPAMVRSALMTTAHQDVRDNDRSSPADPFDMGAGHANAGGKWSKGSIAEPGLVYDAGLLDYLGFLCDMFPEVFANPAATCTSLESAGIATKAYNLNYPSIAIAEVPGTKTVKRTVTSVAKENGNRTYDVSVEVPPGYAVTVHPATISLKRGQTATYSVTVTNVSGPVGEWGFGSLTWHDRTGNYSVYSPIAVKGTLLKAPAEINGSGESGSANFDVAFGYTGNYSAAAHSLIPAAVTSDSVAQDPDQTYDRNDGFSDLHQFTLSGAAYFRVALPPEATEADADLDIFVYNPSGQLVASSTKGGTDEQVGILLPADGTWSVYVHGWSAPGGASDYDMSTWVISATPGGNLSIDSAPTSATIGTVGQVNLSWSGATAGQWHLGAVSHTGASGLMGLTLVEVDNR